MKLLLIRICVIASLSGFIVACTTAKLEARLEANPQCKEIINPKTGAVMPCPGSDKSFYRSVGLDQPSKAPPVVNEAPAPTQTSVTISESAARTPPKQNQVPAPSADCKPSLHKKTGSVLPCPSPD